MDMKTSVIYARVSSVGERQSTSRQVADLTQYATTNGMTVNEIFEEHISGAVKNEERPVLCECLDYCIANGIHTLLISELSRLGRNVDEVLANVKRCKENNLNIYFQRENISIFQADGSKNPFLNIFISVLGAVLSEDNVLRLIDKESVSLYFVVCRYFVRPARLEYRRDSRAVKGVVSYYHVAKWTLE